MPQVVSNEAWLVSDRRVGLCPLQHCKIGAPLPLPSSFPLLTGRQGFFHLSSVQKHCREIFFLAAHPFPCHRFLFFTPIFVFSAPTLPPFATRVRAFFCFSFFVSFCHRCLVIFAFVPCMPIGGQKPWGEDGGTDAVFLFTLWESRWPVISKMKLTERLLYDAFFFHMF